MKIESNKVVVLTYELIVDGQLADKAPEERPLDYIQGTHMLLPKFESELEGKEAGDEYSFTLTPEEGYGPVKDEMVLDLPKSSFTIDGKVREDLLVVGRMIPMLSNMGQVVQGIVKEIKEDMVTMDFNHPMAGKTLNFSGKVLEVRDATEEELKNGLHGEYLPMEEGGHCCHKKGGCHKGKGGCHHKDGEGECCHKDGKEDGECCHKHEGEGCCKDGGENCSKES